MLIIFDISSQRNDDLSPRVLPVYGRSSFFRILCARFSLLYFKRRAGSPLSNDGRVLRLDLTSEICPPLQRSSCLHSDLTTLILSGILNEIHRSEMLLKLYGPSLRCLRSFDLLELIFCLPVDYKLPVLMPSSLLYLPSMTSIRFLLNIFHSLSVKYLPTKKRYDINRKVGHQSIENLKSSLHIIYRVI
jgi:hypothetical protein